MQHVPAQFEDDAIRRIYDEDTETWWFSVIDIIQVLTQQPDYQTARKDWNKLKERLGKEGSESVTNCHRLKLTAAGYRLPSANVATRNTFGRRVAKIDKLRHVLLTCHRRRHTLQTCRENPKNQSRPSRALTCHTTICRRCPRRWSWRPAPS